jgi:drug/metabolite transporter (DMT)-like permease
LDFNRGDLLMLCSVTSWVVYALLIKKLLKFYSGFTLTFYAALFGVAALFFLVLSENFFEQVCAISATSIWAVLYMGVCASGLGYLLYNLSIDKIGPTKTSSFVYSFVPIFVAILASLFFDESITLIMISSICLIILGLYFMMRGKLA